jgi:hypothetical protein
MIGAGISTGHQALFRHLSQNPQVPMGNHIGRDRVLYLAHSTIGPYQGQLTPRLPLGLIPRYAWVLKPRPNLL